MKHLMRLLLFISHFDRDAIAEGMTDKHKAARKDRCDMVILHNGATAN